MWQRFYNGGMLMFLRHPNLQALLGSVILRTWHFLAEKRVTIHGPQTAHKYASCNEPAGNPDIAAEEQERRWHASDMPEQVI